MKILNHLPKTKIKKPVIAIGVFDGLHLGHQALIKKTIKKARAINGTPIVMTFFPHPVQVLNKNMDVSLLVSLKHRLQLIEDLGVLVCVVIRFTKKFSLLRPEEFVEKYLFDSFKSVEIFVGDDFHFGKEGLSGGKALKKIANAFGIRVTIVRSVEFNKKRISSSLLRKLIVRGKLKESEKLLGRRVSTLGKVVHGDRRGARIGTPTANINPGREILPPSGVYLAQVRSENQIFNAIANIGRRPSFKKESKINLEVHIFDFKKRIYGKEIEVLFLQKIRDEQKFKTTKLLIEQIEKDKKKALRYFSQKKF
ncbi:MAG: bifunctional riboflavin kinase/FAD synthetase [Candidatus Omnitrophica bacterium]|nr:bifunctional riboflavin kinase/FAD synthetase [Candidatus Omnitrophota bacterium]